MRNRTNCTVGGRLRLLSALILIAGLLLPVMPAHGAARQEATPAAVPPLLEELAAAWNAHDPQRVAAFYTEDAVVESGFAGEVFARGRDEIANAFVAGNFAAIPDWHFETRSGYQAGDRIIWEWTYSGTYTGQYPGLPPGTGQPVSVRGITIFELRDGLIARDVFYDDAFAFLDQLGLIPAPEEEMPAAATPAA